MKKIILILITIVGIVSCGSNKFKRTTDVPWSTIQLRDNLTYDKAWNEVIDVLATKFEMDMIAKDGGYAKTGWTYTWNKKKKYTENYRNKATIKFSPDRKKIQLRIDSQSSSSGKWKNGYDKKLLKAIKQDLIKVVGRTTR
jgi:spore maturation protein CgeB